MSDRIDRSKVGAARTWAAFKFPYLASALFAAELVPIEGLGGMAVDEQWRLYIDPLAVDVWSVEQVGSVMVHHVGHLLRDHGTRAREVGVSGQEAEVAWVTAADAEINDDLADIGLNMPGEPVTPQALGFEPGRLCEEYYQLVAAAERERTCEGEGDGEATSPGSGEGDCGSAAHGAARDWEQGGDARRRLSPGEANLLRCRVASEVMACNRLGRGDVPAGMLRWAESLLRPAVDWRKVLAAEVRRGLNLVAGAVDYSYRRPSRRQVISPDVVLPSLARPVPTVATVCDTSGSMGPDQLGRVLAEIEGILQSVGCGRERMSVIAVDAAVHAVQRVTSSRQVQLFGGGGTDMGAGIEAAAALKPKPSVCIVLTDGMTPWPQSPPKGMTCVVALVREHLPPAYRQRWRPPSWARVVEVGVPA